MIEKCEHDMRFVAIVTDCKGSTIHEKCNVCGKENKDFTDRNTLKLLSLKYRRLGLMPF